MNSLLTTLPPEIQKAAAIAAAAFLIFIVSKITKPFPLLRALVQLPSTFLHEAAHLAIGFLTGGCPSGFSVIPRRREERTFFGGVRRSWVLGSVTLSRPGFFSCFPTGLAPLTLVPMAWYILQAPLFPETFLGTVARFAAAAIILGGAIPSRQDVAVAFSRLGGAMFYGTAMAAGLLACLRSW